MRILHPLVRCELPPIKSRELGSTSTSSMLLGSSSFIGEPFRYNKKGMLGVGILGYFKALVGHSGQVRARPCFYDSVGHRLKHDCNIRYMNMGFYLFPSMAKLFFLTIACCPSRHGQPFRPCSKFAAEFHPLRTHKQI